MTYLFALFSSHHLFRPLVTTTQPTYQMSSNPCIIPQYFHLQVAKSPTHSFDPPHYNNSAKLSCILPAVNDDDNINSKSKKMAEKYPFQLKKTMKGKCSNTVHQRQNIVFFFIFLGRNIFLVDSQQLNPASWILVGISLYIRRRETKSNVN